jgi:hypothetical protein
MDDAGHVSDAEFHVVEFRGFEKFCEGRPYAEMPGITPASAASARLAICWLPPRPETPSWPLAFRRRRTSCAG